MIDPVQPDFTYTPLAQGRPAFDYAPTSGAEARVSVVTLLPRPDPLLTATARTLARQSLQPWEWLIVSSDPAAAEDVAGDARIRIAAPRTRETPAAAANRLVHDSPSDYVARLEPGDLLESTALEKWLWFLESQQEYAFVDSHSVLTGEAPLLRRIGCANLGPWSPPDGTVAVVLIRKRVFEAAGGYADGLDGAAATWSLLVRCARLAHWGGTVPELLLWRTTPPNGSSDALPAAPVPHVNKFHHSQNAWIAHDLACENVLRKQSRRLLLISPWMTVGGAEKFNLDLLDQLSARGWEITIATTLGVVKQPWLPQFARRTPDIFPLGDFLRLVDYPRFLHYLIRSRQIDVVLVSNSELGYRLLPYLRALCPGVTFVDFCHSELETWNNGGYPRFSVEYQELLDLTIVASRHLKEWMTRRGADGERIEVCYINVDPEQFAPDPEARSRTRQRLGVADGDAVILFAGRISPEKQPWVLGEALVELRRRGQPFTALVAGDGPDAGIVRQSVLRNKLGPAVRMLGEVSPDEMRKLLAASDVFFLPSRWEGIALTLYEAMASGLAVVAADVGGQGELVTPECGILVPRSYPEEEARQYADALGELLRDPERRRRMGDAARDRITRQFRLEEMGERIDSLLERARRLHETEPRPAPGAGTARASAAEAVECVRLLDLAAWQGNVLTVLARPLRVRVFLRIAPRLRPIYRWVLGRQTQWIASLAVKLRGVLLPTPRSP